LKFKDVSEKQARSKNQYNRIKLFAEMKSAGTAAQRRFKTTEATAMLQ